MTKGSITRNSKNIYSFLEPSEKILRYIEIFKYVNTLTILINMDQKRVERVSKALSDPHRIMIIKELKKQKGALQCCYLNQIIDLTQPSVSHHLKLLTDAEILLAEKKGRNVNYVLNERVIDEYMAFLLSLKH